MNAATKKLRDRRLLNGGPKPRNAASAASTAALLQRARCALSSMRDMRRALNAAQRAQAKGRK